MEKRRLNWSTLRHIAVSPRLMKWRAEHPTPDSDALVLGRAIHCAILEPATFASRWVTPTTCAAQTQAKKPCVAAGILYFEGEWYCRIKGHAPEGATDGPGEGIEVIGRDDLEIAAMCAENVRIHGAASKILCGGHSEHEIEWTDPETGIECRGRLDYLRPDTLADLKSTRRETVREFSADVARNLYHGQIAWYMDGAIAAGRLQKDSALPYIVAVSTEAPYDVAAYQLSLASLEAGRILVRDLVNKYQRCVAADVWPGIAPDLVTLELPNWTPGMNGSEESGGW